jgi:RHS repeat-associated protein
MFTGRRYDPETALYYYRARYYDYYTGRFLQTDPTGYSDGLNVYAYVGNNPISWIDPSGLCKDDLGTDGSRKRRIALLEAYIKSAEAAVTKNIEVMTKFQKKKEFWHVYYQTLLVANGLASAVNWSGTAIRFKQLGWHFLKKLTYKPSEAARFVGWGKATDTIIYHSKGMDKATKKIVRDLAISMPGFVGSVIGLTEIPVARRKLIGRNDPYIEQAMQNIYDLSAGVAETRKELRELYE